MKITAQFFGVLLTGLTSVMALAQAVPQLINYQGRLLDADGVPLPTGNYDFEISLFTVESGGSPVWGPQRFNGESGMGLGAKIPVVDGHFNMILGPADVETNNLAQVFAQHSQVFLELKEGDSLPIAPRQQLLAAPYALTAGTAGSLAGNPIFVDGEVSVTGGRPWTANFWSGAMFLEHADAIGWPANTAGQRFGMGHTDGGFLMFRTSSDPGTTVSPAIYDFVINDSGNVGIGTDRPIAKLEVRGTIFATGPVLGNSDVNAKADFAPVDTAAILERVINLPIQQWRFKTEAPEVKHVGPMAQEFRAAFGLGELPSAIATVDADGIALAAIQGLHRLVRDKDAEIQELKQSMLELQVRMNQLAGQRNPAAQSSQP